jgi:predicted nucleotidyltransferase
MNREQMIKTLRRSLADADPSVLAAWLFGSVARGEHKRGSDIDIALLFDQPPPARLFNPAAALQGALVDRLGCEVDTVVVDKASPDLVHRVLRDGILLLDRNPDRRIGFEVRARNAYFDIKPYLDEYRGGAVR